jgi:NADH:ubiquinone oxidoreductase subunit F (NADH-binding)/(2Fe-2S) ferredoxin/NAD-dependent dihydropyrimidine dehydrogenase PreA subunit
MTEASRSSYRVLICQGTGCVSMKSPDIQAALEEQVRELGLSDVQIDLTGCHGFCQQGPIVIVEPDGIFYAGVQVKDAADIATQHLQNGEPVERLFYRDPNTGEAIPKYEDIPFYKGQERVVLRHCGRINPERIDHYLAADGYVALRKVLSQMTSAQVVDEIKVSGLRGRGGAGFPSGVKWDFCRQESADQKYVICNADEGDPGAFMDRSILEASPHSVLEGMAIAGHAIGASRGYLYVRAEYPLAIERLSIAVDQARKRGFLGDDILGSGFSFDVALFEGAGAFVCGEETALLLSIEGARGMPRPRPPFPAQSGLWGKPTLINNVKTLATVPEIIRRGAEWFAGIGTEKSKGTAVFALTGNVANSGLIEVPMGTPLRHIISSIGGGVQDGKPFKAVQTGGPSGGCLPASLLDTPVDFESLAAVGSIMGSGGMVVMDEHTCMVDVARYFIDFTQKESCGKCGPCRLGTKQMLDILEGITQKKGTPEDIDLLVEIGEAVKAGSLCGLGQTAPNPVLTTIRYFRDEYIAHLEGDSCPAKVCRDFVYYRISPETCKGCHLCAKACPQECIAGERKEPHIIDQSACIHCGMCYEACPPKIRAVERLTGKEALEMLAAG